jgi:hypothetical protein
LNAVFSGQLSVEPLAKFLGDCEKRQGTTLVVPQVQQGDDGL